MIHLEEFEIFRDRTFLGMTDKNFNLNYMVKVYQSMQHIKYQLYNKYYQLYTTYKTIYCSAWPRLKLNTKIGLHTTHHHPPPTTTTTTQTLRQQYLSCYWPDFYLTLNVGSWVTSRTDSNWWPFWILQTMSKCPQDKCFLDKWRGDSCNLLYMFPGPFV